MRRMFPLLILAAASQFCAPQLQAQKSSPAVDAETKEQHDARMAWWRDARFGMFIHWGVYSVPAGIYHGKPVSGLGEWIMAHAKIPMAEYQAFAKEFNPRKFDADEWVRVAKEAGMKYIVITTKHHDGFAMFDSKASDWNIVKATPYGKDVIKQLADACRKQGMKLGFYYSQALDWNNGGSTMHGAWDPAQNHDMDDYIAKVGVPQVREILSNYGEFPSVLWWDMSIKMTPERVAKYREVANELKPDLIMNNRLGPGFHGDTETPEQVIPPQGYPNRDWETCMTMNKTWGYTKNDHDWKSTEMLLRNLCDIASKGGNYLLNVGPNEEGLIPRESVDRLRQIGAWMKVNGEAIYGTGPTPFGAEAGKFSETEKEKNGKPKFIADWEWRCTSKPGKLYAMLFKWPADGKFTLPGLQSKVTKAYLLADPGKEPLQTEASQAGVTVSLPAKAPDAIASVVCFEIADPKASLSMAK